MYNIFIKYVTIKEKADQKKNIILRQRYNDNLSLKKIGS